MYTELGTYIRPESSRAKSYYKEFVYKKNVNYYHIYYISTVSSSEVIMIHFYFI